MTIEGVSKVQTLVRYQMLIGGERVDALAGATYESSDPFTGLPWAVVPDGDVDDIERAVVAARTALDGPWGSMTGFERAALIRKLGDLIVRDADRLGEVETRDNGRLLREMQGIAKYIAQWFYYYAGVADKLEGRSIPSDKPNFMVYTRRLPIGVVGAILPWNSPLLILGWKLAPALAAGCTFIAKPSDYTPASTLEIAALALEAGFPPGVVNVVTGLGPATGAALAEHPGVDKIAFTGSTKTGISVAHSAAQNLTQATLELGGKSPHVVFPDADLEAATNGIIGGIFAATGQNCLSGSRLIVHRSIHDELVARVVKRAEQIVLGDPRDEKTDIGPLANGPQFQKVLRYLEIACQEGATIETGGSRSDELGGFFVAPTVLTGLTADMTVVTDEIFGPVLSVLTFETEEEGVTLANDTQYGLAGAVWTRDVARAHRVAHQIKAGTVWINAYRVLGPNAPFGGMKESGFGRENGIEAVEGYLETQTVWVELSGQTRDPFMLA